ncbi:hypothetical protein BD770DRAFT_476132 [Pilaira anomala]|nr:hypothetical protein BD770DRAFT_476132 [Pilaira anomala]
MGHIMSDYIHLLVSSIKGRKSLDTLHYLCVVPWEWDHHKIREQLFRPIFIQAGLILETDHNDRLLFLSDTESIFYGVQVNVYPLPELETGPGCFKTGDFYILWRIENLEDETKTSTKSDLIEVHNSAAGETNIVEDVTPLIINNGMMKTDLYLLLFL